MLLPSTLHVDIPSIWNNKLIENVNKIIPKMYLYSTHLSLDKMAVISQTIFLDAVSWMEIFCILNKISLKLVPRGPIDNNPALV